MAENEEQGNDEEQDKDRRIRDLEAQVEHLSRMLIKSFNYAEEDPDTFLQNARKTTEAICRFIYAQEIGPPKEKMLLNELAKGLRNQKAVPDRILILIGTIQTYGNYGAHAQEGYEESTREWIAPCQTALANLTNWFFSEYLQGKVPMPDELVQPVKEKAREQSAPGKARKQNASIAIASVLLLAVLAVGLFIYPGWLAQGTGDASGGGNATVEGSSGGGSGKGAVADTSDGGAEDKKKAEARTDATIDSLNEKTTVGPKTRLAILYFENSSDKAELDQLRKGLASMLISDLSQLDGLKVVERARLQEVLEEQKLSNSEKFDASTAAKVGKLLGAEKILIGSYFEMMGKLRVDARTIDVETGEVLHSEGLEDSKARFFALEKKLARRIAEQLELGTQPPKTADSGIPYDAANTYSAGLDLLDAGKMEKARKKFKKVLETAPDFGPARDALERTQQAS